jgi:hypothetical protein
MGSPSLRRVDLSILEDSYMRERLRNPIRLSGKRDLVPTLPERIHVVTG